jgi:putative transposase
VSCPIGEIPIQAPNYNNEAGHLKESKELFPDYKNIYADVQQQNLKRLDNSWWRWLVPDKTGKRAGRPKFKKKGELRSFTFPRINHPKAGIHIKYGVLRVSKIGTMPVIMHRPIPDGFVLKTCTIVKKADGWYACIGMEDETVPDIKPLASVKNYIGVDVGLKEFLTTSSGQSAPIPQIYRKAQSHLARQQRYLARKEKGSLNFGKQQNHIAKIHQRIKRQRENFHYTVAHWLVKTYDLIAVEDLNIKGLARNSKLAKSILDAAWGAFIKILESVAVKCGVHVLKVNPHSTSVDCSGCGAKVPKTLSVRTHQCPKCNLEIDRDENAAINILNRALSAVGLIVPAFGGLGDTQPLRKEAWTRFVGTQLSLF